MNILFVTIAWPDSGERNLYSDLMDEFVEHGHYVYVAGTHNSVDGKNSLIQKEKWGEVLLLHTRPIRKTSQFRKALALLALGPKLYKAINYYFKNV